MPSNGIRRPDENYPAAGEAYMGRSKVLILAVLATALWLTGCTKEKNMARADKPANGGAAATPSKKGSSSKLADQGGNGHAVVSNAESSEQAATFTKDSTVADGAVIGSRPASPEGAQDAGLPTQSGQEQRMSPSTGGKAWYRVRSRPEMDPPASSSRGKKGVISGAVSTY